MPEPASRWEAVVTELAEVIARVLVRILWRRT